MNRVTTTLFARPRLPKLAPSPVRRGARARRRGDVWVGLLAACVIGAATAGPPREREHLDRSAAERTVASADQIASPPDLSLAAPVAPPLAPPLARPPASPAAPTPPTPGSAATTPAIAPAPTSGAGRWAARLEALRPTRPMEYFVLAEEVADAAAAAGNVAAREERRLARQLFGLAGLLDPPGLARSAALALAELAEDAAASGRLRTAAALLDTRGGAVLGPGGGGGADGDVAAAMALSEALSHYRRGQGPRVAKLLGQPGVAALLEQHGSAIDGGPDRLREDAKAYRGQARPILKPAAITRLIQLEVGLLSGRSRPWSADLLLTGDRPLAEVDPGRLDELFEVDRTRCVWRAGGWSAP